MKYIIEEEELDYIRDNLDYDEDRYYVMKKIEEIKSKSPVEEIESGTVQGDFGYYLGDRMVKHYGKKVKIYIEVIK